MNNDDKFFLNRIQDLAKASYTQNRYTFSTFLSLDEQSLVDQIASEISYAHYTLFGGHECCERQVIRFGSQDVLGYEEDFPITTLCIEPLMEKFSEELGHRDYLGALMNLGIKRNVIGDIIIKDGKAYVFCLDEIADYICSEITRIRHTSVLIKPLSGEISVLERKLEDMEILVSSPRFDAVVAALTKKSRSQTVELFREKKVLCNNKICENNSLTLKPGNSFSIRGFGKYIYEGEGGKTRKDRVYVKLRKYV